MFLRICVSLEINSPLTRMLAENLLWFSLISGSILHRQIGIFARSGVILLNSNATSLDAIDYRILRELVNDGRVADVQLGERVNLSSTAVARRRRILEENGIITGYNANINMTSLGFTGVVVVAIELSSQAEHVLVEFEREVVRCPSISYCGFVSGDTDFMIMIHVNSFNDYDRIYRRELSNLPHVAKIRSSFVLREVARRATPPVIFDSQK